MDGKLLVLCDERPTINSSGDYIDENGKQLLQKEDGSYSSIDGKQVAVDPRKKVISMIDLLNPIQTPATESDILYADWNTFLETDIDYINEMRRLATNGKEITPEFILQGGKSESLTKRAYMEVLLNLDKMGLRGTEESLHYSFIAADKLLRLFTEALNCKVVAVLPALPKEDAEGLNPTRMELLKIWKDNNVRIPRLTDETKWDADLLEPEYYEQFGEIYPRASKEMLNIISKPYFFEESPSDGEPGGRE